MSRHAPLFNEWRAKLETATAAQGTIAELADLLAAHLGIEFRSARTTIHRTIAGTEPRAEIVLFLDGWLKRPKKSNRHGPQD